MIVRIMAEGQFVIPQQELDGLNELDAALQDAVDAGDEQRFSSALAALLDRVRTAGTPASDDVLTPSELVLPATDSTLAEVRAMLGDEGLIPG
jgi:hypothetical protein